MNELDSRCGDYVQIAIVAKGVDLTRGYDHDVIRGCINLAQLWVSDLHDKYVLHLQYLYEEEGKLHQYENGIVPSDFEHTKLLRDYNRSMVAMKENMVSLLLAGTQFKTFHYEYAIDDFDYLANQLNQFSRLKRLVIEAQRGFL
ncbi:uncharacterized protein ATC70_002330 [Mucor velutinosus]|uniref:Uncharacterized protein n=1 Tax=Mucor velutinosus TaxID=708070 RepID=A0AAN7DCL5_9FUNG|nr:hypothetical protein ATC70_002330 [Mucor velutinosus]